MNTHTVSPNKRWTLVSLWGWLFCWLALYSAVPIAVYGDESPEPFQFQDTFIDRVTRSLLPSIYWRNKVVESQRDLDDAYKAFQESAGRYRHQRIEILHEMQQVTSGSPTEIRQTRRAILQKHRADLEQLRQESRAAGHLFKQRSARLLYAERSLQATK